uniref:Uncharacterized protein n=1 Tax=Brassica oleracea TaxID=3712 RepID=A0A3P6A6U6_BRAOL|nr:unnamed protein product [Brassica oleracea]
MSFPLCYCPSGGSFFGRWFQLFNFKTISKALIRMITPSFDNISDLVGIPPPMISRYGSKSQWLAVFVNSRFTVIPMMMIYFCRVVFIRITTSRS